ncbi:MAG: sulfite exporter TauE/SafE family protein, partial [Armatimonadota bacterium]
MTVALIAVLTVVAGGVGTLTGFGTSTIMVPALVMFFPLPETLLLVGIIHWFGDVWKIWLFKRGIRWKLWLAFGITGVLYSYWGAMLSVSAPEDLMKRILGGVLVAYVVFLFTKQSFELPATTGMAGIGGAASGFMAGIFGVGGAVRGAFLAAFDLKKAVYIATSGAIAIVIDTARIGEYIHGGTRLAPELLWGMLLFIPASFVGAELAKGIVERIPQEKYAHRRKQYTFPIHTGQNADGMGHGVQHYNDTIVLLAHFYDTLTENL